MANLIPTFWLQLINYEIRIVYRQAFSWCTPLLFFIIVVSLFPLALGPDTELLKKIAPGIIWVGALLSVLISMGQLFCKDEEEGFLDILLVSQNSIKWYVFIKIISHWMSYSVPLILTSPLLGFLLNLTFKQELILILSLLLGTTVFCFIGAIGAALMVGIRTHGLLLPILIMPFYIPVLIFGTSSVYSSEFQQPVSGHFALLGAYMIFSILITTPLTAMALRIGANE